ncbi:MAG TPA: two-component regulator propeller domain-containing protein, partial [Bryobacteraceae bacterium]|nr:two-component regulator propeller domain-containing protein [Bryobacteraceae bacterium]
MSKAKRAPALATVVALNAFVWSPAVLALDPSLDVRQYAHASWTVRGGFFKGLISTIVQTPDGYIWFGTEHGLVRFDGVTRVDWQPPAGERLPSKYIKSLLVARDGTLWIGTFAGLVSWNRTKLTHYPEMSGLAIGTLLEDDDGTIWVGGEAAPRGRLCAIKRDGVECYGEDGSLGYEVMSLYQDHQRNLWVGAATGLWCWKPGPPRHYPATGIMDSPLGLIQDERRVLLAASHDEIRQIVNDKAEPYRLPGRDHRVKQAKFLRDRDGGLWIGTSNDGLFHLHRGRMDVFNSSNGLSGNQVKWLFEDRERNIWVATLDGVDRFRDVAVPTYSVAQGLSNPVVVSVLAARDGSVWLGTIDGLNRWHAGQITQFRRPGAPSLPQAVAGGAVRKITASGLPHDSIQSLYQDHRGRIWVSIPRRIAWFENGHFHPISLETGGRVSSITGDSVGNLWISAVPGLTHLVDMRVVEQIPWSAFGDHGVAYSLIAGRDAGGLWLGFYKGGVAWFKDGQVRRMFTEAHGLGRGHVSALHLDAQNALWAATEGGLSRLKDGRVATLTQANGLPCETILWVTQDDKRDFWFYTECGLVRISRAELNAWSIDSKRVVETAVFDVSEGVRSRSKASDYEPRVAKSEDGKLWFLPLDGVSIADPERLTRAAPFNNVPPPVHIERIKADDKFYEPRPGLRLPAHVRDVWIDYTALSLAVPERVRFRYKLEGQDPDWKEVINERQAQYTNLAPREYRFRVIASNHSGVWNETGDTLEFSVAPAFYQTNWFKVAITSAFLTLLWAAYQLRVRRLQREFRKLRDLIDTIPAMAWTARPDGSNLFVNRRWAEYTGVFPEERGDGSAWLEAVHPDDRQRSREIWRTALASGEPFEDERRFRAADGNYRWFLSRGVPLRDGRGKILSWYGVLTDIEDRKRAETEREKRLQLEADLSHINRVSMMGELAASIAHEVNQPLSGIVNNGSACLRWLAVNVPNLDEAREAARRIVRDGKRAGEVVAHIRALTKRAAARIEKLDLNQTILELIALVGDEAKTDRVVIRTDFANDLAPVSGDRVQLQQVVLNLVMNAIQAMCSVDEHARRLVIITRNTDSDQVQVTIEDSGPGLDPKTMPRIFEPFYTTKAGGMGMGLSISRSI